MPNTGTTLDGQRQPSAFLSYSRADQALARKLTAELQAAGLDVWWDTLIEGGAAFAKSIETALDNADAVLVLWSATSTASDWVLDEAARGRDLHKLVPATLDGTPAPLGFRQYHAIDLTRWVEGKDEAAVDDLVRAVIVLTGRTPPPKRLTNAPKGIDVRRRKLMIGAVAASAAAGMGWVAWQRFGQPTAKKAAANSVAVLPFSSDSPAQAYFSDGLSEEVRSTLARNMALQVMAKSSSGNVRTGEKDAETIAHELGVTYLLEGGVRRAGDDVRISANLIDGGTGRIRWSQVFERKVADVFAVQTEIAYAVADALSAYVGGKSGNREDLAALGGTRNANALDAYLRGRTLYDLDAGETSDRGALTQFDLAIAADAGFASAHAARARSLTAIANQYGAAAQLRDMYTEAIAAAERAIQLAPELAQAHSTQGFTLFQGQLDAHAAREPFERSIELGAGEATVLARYAQYSARTGRDAVAVKAMHDAMARDPLNPLIHRAAGDIEYAARRFETAIPYLQKSLEMNPRISRSNAAIGDALLNMGKVAKALAAYAKEPSPYVRLTGLAIAQKRAGDPATASQTLATLVAQLGDRVLYQQAQVHAQLGDIDVAFARLAAARNLGDSGLIYARNDPFLDPLRTDHRMSAVLAGVGFDWPSPAASS